jgi:hypothetical protein
VSLTTVFKRALHVFSNSAFPRDGSLDSLPPVVAGTSFALSTDAECINFVKVHPQGTERPLHACVRVSALLTTRHRQTQSFALSYMTSFKAKDANISVARMVNAAGSVVSPTQAAVQAAMAYFRPVIDQGALCLHVLGDTIRR